jgi:hypothetical protein
MVVHSGWTYIGEGQEYVAYLVGGNVIKVPRVYFNDRLSDDKSFHATQVAHRQADFDLECVAPYKIDTWLAYGQQQVEDSKLYKEFGVLTHVDSLGLIHQQYVEGREPTKTETQEFRKLLRVHVPRACDMFEGNFRITP